MSTYATTDDFADYTGLDLDDNTAGRLLEFAERDVDRIVTLTTTRTAAGLKLDPDQLTDHQAAALMRATCAQAEYRNAKGEEFFIHGQHGHVSGPDFTTDGKLPYIGPKVYRELAGTGLAHGQAVSVPVVSPYSDWGDPSRLDFPWPMP